MESKILSAKYNSGDTPLRLGNLEIPCYVLEDGTRVFSGRGIQKVLGYGDKRVMVTRFCNQKRFNANIFVRRK